MKKEQAKKYIERRGFTLVENTFRAELAGTPILVDYTAYGGKTLQIRGSLNGIVEQIKRLN